MTDTEMLDWLEEFVNVHDALVLHDGGADVGKYSGLGLRPGNVRRTLREAIADAAGRTVAPPICKWCSAPVPAHTKTGKCPPMVRSVRKRPRPATSESRP